MQSLPLQAPGSRQANASPTSPPLWQATSSFSPVSRQSHSAGSATRQQVTPAVQANHQHLAPRGAVQRRSYTLLLPPGVRKRQAPVPSQKTPGSPEGRPGPFRETARCGRPGPAGVTSPSPALKCLRGPVRPDRRRPCPSGEVSPLASPPALGSKEQPGAPHSREHQRP
ncbi:hypothetical protein NDU88_007118 [Pleurodeles waltl]|uniref:Uncharacterized protein n=1 Tax=Pleurodeles waltl TaxID=8319 RepID=A0AAV7VR82_PLEWA|nr:hypothetical protein NDU88_007118 [Pleurodeles waltl]